MELKNNSYIEKNYKAKQRIKTPGPLVFSIPEAALFHKLLPLDGVDIGDLDNYFHHTNVG